MIGSFTATDLLKYRQQKYIIRDFQLSSYHLVYSLVTDRQRSLSNRAESLVKDAMLLELKSEDHSNYSWLNSKHVQQECIDVYLESFKPMIQKMSPESCAAVAVKLDILTEHSTSTDHILATLKTLLQEQDSITLMAGNVKRAKEKKKVKVYPVLEGREATVSFVVKNKKV